MELRGVKAGGLNGRRGVVAAFNAATGRCSVQLDDGRPPINVKPENVALVPAAGGCAAATGSGRGGGGNPDDKAAAGK